jgi:hypothetical protein
LESVNHERLQTDTPKNFVVINTDIFYSV